MNPNDPMDQQRRVFTDERFPDMEIVNYGNTQFEVYQLNKETGRYDVVDDFTGHEHHGKPVVSELFAARRAQRYFDQLAYLQPIHDEAMARFDAEEAEGLDVNNTDRDATDVVNAPARDFADEQIMTPDQVLDMWEKANAMPPGPEKDKLLAQVRKAASEMESCALEVVNHILAS